MGELAGKIRRFKNKLDGASTKVPAEAGKQLTKEKIVPLIEAGLTGWYFSYSPDVYDRTLDLNNGAIAGTKVSFSGNTLTVTVTSDSVGQHSHDSGEYVFKGAFIQGIHGTSQIFKSTPPWEYYEPEIGQLCDEELGKALENFVNSL